MELRHLRYFVAVAESGSFTSAAERLHTAQPSLSRQIRDLEEHVGAALLERSTRRMTLTGAGRVFLDEARLTLAQADRAVARVRQLARGQAARLTLGFVYGAEAEQLAGVMNALSGRLKNIELTMHSQSSPTLIAQLRRGEIDAAFVRPSGELGDLQVRTLRKEKLVVAMRADHPLARRRRVGIAELVGQPFVKAMREQVPALHHAIEDFSCRHDIELYSAYQSENLLMALSFVSSVGGVCLVGESAVRLFPPGVVARPLAEDTPTIDLALVWNPASRSAALAAFLETFEYGAGNR